MSTAEEARRLLAEQQEYYRARAPEYDEYFLRRGRYDQGAEENARWFREGEQVQRALAPGGDVLELAGGTGWWTEHLLRTADRVTVVDGSLEMMAVNRARVGADAGRVEYVHADLFEWTPARTYDAVFFGFWLSHVPPDRFDAFWAMVRAALRPGGRAYFVDSLQPATSAPHPTSAEDPDIALRRLNDGREFRVVKIFWEPVALAARLRALGWSADVRATERFFVYGSAAPRG